MHILYAPDIVKRHLGYHIALEMASAWDIFTQIFTKSKTFLKLHATIHLFSMEKLKKIKVRTL